MTTERKTINLKYRKLYALMLMLLWGIIFSACHKNKQSENDPLFRMVKPGQSGIDFSNQLQETDTANSIFYEYYVNGSGLAIGDVNNDGLSDIFFGANMTNCALYLNKGNLKFEDITKKAGIHTTGKWVTGVTMADINQDGWLDIYLSVGGNILDDYTNLLFISNGNKDNLVFSECAGAAGLADQGYTTQTEFFDYDRDGDLDAYLVTSAMNIPNKNTIRTRKNDGSVKNTDRLYRNEGIDPSTGIPRFRNMSHEAGILWDGFGLGTVICDINRDGWPDIYVCCDYISNDLLYVNQKDGTFRDMLKDYVKHTSYSAMGMDIADFNNDGLLDIFTLDMQPEDYFRKRIMAGNMRSYERYMQEIDKGYSHQFVRNMLQLNQGYIEGQYRFIDIGQMAGVSETDWSWAPLFADFDNDGFRDLFIGNGIEHDMTNMDFSELWQKKNKENPNIEWSVLYKVLISDLRKRANVKKPNFIFRNSGTMVFEDVTKKWGLTQHLYSTGSAYSDLDNDGDLDLVLNNINDVATVYENTTVQNGLPGNNSHFLSITLAGSEMNKGGIGAKINLYYGGKQQYYEHYPVRGFQSMVDPKVHFGTGSNARLDSLIITWPDDKFQKLVDVPADQDLKLDYKNAAGSRITAPKEEGNTVFTRITGKMKPGYLHSERKFMDFKLQPLVPHQYSQEGPGIAVGDVNSDGMDDFFIGGSTSYSGMIFKQEKNGSFSSSPLPDNNNYEDMGSLLFDADEDGDNDLYVVSGGSGLPPGNQFYADRLYMNDGKGRFILNKNALPDQRVCGSQVTASDFDRDGDLDLFVCGRVNLEQYPAPPRSFLLRNDTKGSTVSFTDVTASVCPALEAQGLLAAALWTDFNKDGWTDLILAGEWMPLSFFRNNKGKFTDITSSTGLSAYTGWWNSITGADFDNDGDIDYVAGNLGMNSDYKVSQEQPMRIFAKDFDMNGTIDPVCSYYVQGKSYPIYHRIIFMSQLPSYQNRFRTYEDYARATIDDIFPPESLERAYIRDAKYFKSAYIENLGNETFRITELPLEAQVSPVFGIVADDFDSDGNTDVLMTGNSYSSNIYTGRYDSFIGLLLTGNGKGAFTAVSGPNSGFFVDGDAKSLASLTGNDGSTMLLAAQNSDSLRVFRTEASGKKVIRLKRDDVSALITYKSGKTEYREYYYGSGYLSQSSRVCVIPEGVSSVSITDYKGESRKITE